MATKPTKSDYETITQELYKKNLELFNANKEMALFQKLYEIIVASLKTSDVAQMFVDTIVHDLEFFAGSAHTLRCKRKSPKNRCLLKITQNIQDCQSAKQAIRKNYLLSQRKRTTYTFRHSRPNAAKHPTISTMPSPH